MLRVLQAVVIGVRRLAFAEKKFSNLSDEIVGKSRRASASCGPRRGTRRGPIRRPVPMRLSSTASRRGVAALLAPLLVSPVLRQDAFAFDNALPEYRDQDAAMKVKPGPRPTDIGLQKRMGDLRPCVDGKV